MLKAGLKYDKARGAKWDYLHEARRLFSSEAVLPSILSVRTFVVMCNFAGSN